MYRIQADDEELGGREGEKKALFRYFHISTPHERSMRVTWSIWYLGHI